MWLGRGPGGLLTQSAYPFLPQVGGDSGTTSAAFPFLVLSCGYPTPASLASSLSEPPKLSGENLRKSWLPVGGQVGLGDGQVFAVKHYILLALKAEWPSAKFPSRLSGSYLLLRRTWPFV